MTARAIVFLSAALILVAGAHGTRTPIMADDQVGTVVVTVQDQRGAPVPNADIVTVIEGFDFNGHSTADAQGHATKLLLAGRHISICADYNYLHGACAPGFILAPGETRSVTVVLDLSGLAVGTPTSETPTATPTPKPSDSSSPIAAPPASAASPSSPLPPCQLVLGFRALYDLLPSVVGTCLDDERHDAQNGDGLQHTTHGLLVWRKADNSTAFTDGYRTWVNGPRGLQERLNAQRFSWEANPDGLPVIP